MQKRDFLARGSNLGNLLRPTISMERHEWNGAAFSLQRAVKIKPLLPIRHHLSPQLPVVFLLAWIVIGGRKSRQVVRVFLHVIG
jgi:hypothetical protein